MARAPTSRPIRPFAIPMSKPATPPGSASNCASPASSSDMPRMTPQEVHDYLDEPGRLVRIGTVDDTGTPLVVPAWFIVENGELMVTPRERSSWFANLQRSPKVCFTIDGDGKQVIVRGTVRVVHAL